MSMTKTRAALDLLLMEHVPPGEIDAATVAYVLVGLDSLHLLKSIPRDIEPDEWLTMVKSARRDALDSVTARMRSHLRLVEPPEGAA